MVRACPSGGRLSDRLQDCLERATRVHAQGKLDAAEALYQEILAQSPHEPNALHMLGVIAQQKGQSQLALQWFDAAITAKPDFLQPRFNRCVVLRVLGRKDEALQTLHKILESVPEFAVAWDLAGQILKDEGDLFEAEKCYRHALGLQPGNPHFHGNFALLLFAQGDLAAAYEHALIAETLDPAYPPILLGNILRTWGHPEKAAACFARARTLLPNFADAYASEAMARLQIGDFEKGLALWEKRPDLSSDMKETPPWQGQKVASLLLYEDQGLGDALQFLRYLPLLKPRAEKLILRLREPLANLAAKNFPKIEVVLETSPAPAAKARCRLSSLPFFFETRLSTIPSAPYLSAPDSAFGRTLIKDLPPPRIGLVWAGNAHFRNDLTRSIPFQTLAPVLQACTPLHFVSLQKERADMPDDCGVFDAAPFLKNFADTASLIAALDLVISVDTATAHLAGAMGKPVFVLLPFNSDWRWLIEREDSPWYPSARLFRQKKLNDWASVMAQLTDVLQKFLSGDTSALRPAPWQGGVLRENPNAVPFPPPREK